jgi:hypothetical protein
MVTRATLFGNPFGIMPPVRGLSRSWQVHWTNQGAGIDRVPPADYETLMCETEHQAHEQAVRLFREWLTASEQADLLDQAQHELVGFNLACWCRLDMPCHADVWLDLVNQP